MLWVDKYRPTDLDKLDYHDEITDNLHNLSSTNDLPHLLIYGPSGAGKKTRIMALLKQLYGPNALKIRLEHKSFHVEGKTSNIELTTVASNYHIEMNPSDVGNNDRFVVQEILKEIAQYHLADTNAKKPFKVVLLTEVDQMSKLAQHALRRTMEKYTTSCRLILYCNNPSKIIEPLRSRCVGIRIPAPSINNITAILEKICRNENINSNSKLNEKIAIKSERNLRRSILMLETCYTQKYPFTDNQEVQIPDWEEFITVLGKDILKEQTPACLLRVRNKLYELLSNCIPSDVIIKVLSRELIKCLDDDLKRQVVHLAAYYEHRLQCGSKDIIHLEAFVAKFMTVYKKFLLEFFD